MRRSFVQINGVLYEKGTEPRGEGLLIMGDITPYKSMLTGEEISSRSKHREHLRAHGAVEVGNDSSLSKPYTGIPDVAPQQRSELIRAQVNDMTHEQFKRAVKKDLDNLRWNSRER